MICSYTISFGFSEIFIVLMGIFIGAMWGIAVVLRQKKNKVLKHITPSFSKIEEDKKVKINQVINNLFIYHKETRKKPYSFLFGLVKIKKKNKNIDYAKKYLEMDVTDSICISLSKELSWLCESIAKVFYPDSDYPLYELTIDEAFLILREVINIIEQTMIDINIPDLDEVKVSNILQVLKITKKAKHIYNIKGVKISVSIINGAIKIRSVITPIYWIKKGTKNVTANSLGLVVIQYLFEVIGKEVAYIYSKGYLLKDGTVNI